MGVYTRSVWDRVLETVTCGKGRRLVWSLVEDCKAEEGSRPGASLIRGDMAVVLFSGVDLLAN